MAKRTKKPKKCTGSCADTIEVFKGKRSVYWRIVNERARSLKKEKLLVSESYSSRKSALASARAHHRRHPEYGFVDLTA